MRKKIPNTPITYSRRLPSWKNVLSKVALYEYTNKMSNAIKKAKNTKGRLYSKYIMRKMKPRNYNTPLYRGIKGNFDPKKKTLTSFTKNIVVANSYSGNKGHILVLNNPKRIPSVNYEYYKSEYPGEMEVLVAPGSFKIKKRNGRFIHVNYQV